MKFVRFTLQSSIVGTVIPCLALLGCGGGQANGTLTLSSPYTNASASVGVLVSQAPTSPPSTSPTVPVTPAPPVVTPPSTVDGTVTDIGLVSTDNAPHTNVPVTFGQVFARGDLAAGVSISGKLPDGTIVPLQMDVKATHADGSVRHAIFSAVIPKLPAEEVRMSLARSTATTGTTPAASALLAAGFTSSVNLTIDGTVYSVSADQLLKDSTAKAWISGPIANEWMVSAPLRSSTGTANPNLTARFAIRWYTGSKTARVDVTVENAWAYGSAPQQYNYDASILVGGKAVYSANNLAHYHHTRWRKTFWWGDAPAVHLKHNARYLTASMALPNYDLSVVPGEATIAGLVAQWKGPRTEPMGSGLANPFMPDAGGRGDIGLLPNWSAIYLTSMDKRAKDVMLGTADLAGSWSGHYRDRNTDRPVSLIDYPFMTLLGNPSDTFNPATQKFESFPACAPNASCGNPNTIDTSHQPAFSYLPYLVTGDYYYLEELQFYAMSNLFTSNPGYRDNIKGLVKSDQVRGQAWSMRTLAEVSYVTPDKDPLKDQFLTLLNNNLDYYNTKYIDNSASTNKLGIITDGYWSGYNDGRGMSPWMDDFFTSAIGHVSELGFSKADKLLKFKAKFPISRMIGDGTCYITGAAYYLNVRDDVNSPVYSTIAETYTASNTAEFRALQCGSAAMGAALGLKAGEMTGYSSGTEGYPSNMQPALAYAATVGGAEGAAAWKTFINRSVKPDYSTSPQFSIVPR